MGADVTVTNSGKVAGDGSSSSISNSPSVKGAPLIALRGFERIRLDPVPARRFISSLKARDLGTVTEDGNPIIAPGDYTVSVGGGQPDTSAPGVTARFHIEANMPCPSSV